MHDLGDRKLRRVPTGKGSRIDITLPEEVLALSKTAVGDRVRVTVSRRGEIRLTPMRPDWPKLCGQISTVFGSECGRRKGHAGECIPEDEV